MLRFACYSLQICLLIVVAKFALYLLQIHSSQVTGCRNRSLRKITRCSLHKLLVAKNYSLLDCMKSVQIRSFFWSVFFCIRTKYGNLQSKSPYSVRIQENTDSVFRHFSCSASFKISLLLVEEITCCKRSVITCCGKLLAIRRKNCLVQKSFFTSYENHSLEILFV